MNRIEDDFAYERWWHQTVAYNKQDLFTRRPLKFYNAYYNAYPDNYDPFS